MIMQPYPIWVVLEDKEQKSIPGLCLIIGWSSSSNESVYEAYLVDLVNVQGDVEALKYEDETSITHLFVDFKEACDFRKLLGEIVAPI